MPRSINFSFISELEGGCTTVACVPNPGGSKSGVTIATGFDLGARSLGDLENLGLESNIVEKLAPYLGLQSYDAEAELTKEPLQITQKEAELIDEASHQTHADSIAKRYDEATPSNVSFDELHSAIQTVIASVSFQYGINLSRRTPNFWKMLVRQDWPSAINELNNFGDSYPTRRKKEAALLSQAV